MGLIRRFFAPWRAAEQQDALNEGILQLLREIIRVANAQTETNQQMQLTMQQFAGMFLTDGQPSSWTNDEEAQLMAEFMARVAAEESTRQDN